MKTRIIDITEPKMFARVLAENPQLAKKVLRVILGREIDDLVCTNAEEVVSFTRDERKYGCYDVHFKDRKTYAVIALQNQKEPFWPQRNRYYQAMHTMECQRGRYECDGLEDSLFIWIMNEVPFDDNLPKYTFCNTCKENPNPLFNGQTFADGHETVILNLSADRTELSDDLAELMEYFRTGIAREEGLTAELEAQVRKINTDTIWIAKMIMLESDRVHRENLLLNRGREEGRTEGIAESRKEMAGRMLAAKEPDEKIILYSGATPEELELLKQV